MSNQSSAEILQSMEDQIVKAEENAAHWITVAEVIRGLRAEILASKQLKKPSGNNQKTGLYTDKKALLQIAKEVKLLMVVTGLSKTEACAIYAERKNLGVGGPTLIGYLGKKVLGEKQAKMFNKVHLLRETYLQDPDGYSDDNPVGKVRNMAKEWGVLS